MAQPFVSARGLGKIFGSTPVLRGVDLDLPPGRGAMLIGGNGAGKSTLVKILAGLSAPSSGQAIAFGEETRRLAPHSRRRIGLMTHQSFLYPNLTARENLEFYASLYHLGGAPARIARWLERVGLSRFADARVRGFSRGMEQRLCAARIMISDPDVLLLDEPFAALDNQGVAMMGGLIREAIERGAAVLATAHGPLAVEGVEFDLYKIFRGRLMRYEDEGRPMLWRVPLER
jgi:heme ABC exporter ATP-binding subunit CcmA